MANKSAIEWTDATWNPVRGCSIVSKGCVNCYAMRQAHRSSGAGGAYEGLTKLTNGGPVWTGEVRTVPELLDWPLRRAKPMRIFVNSMSDLFHEDVPFQMIADVFAVMACTTRHKYQVLTKRPHRMLEWFRWLELGHFDFPEQVDPPKVWPQWTPLRGSRGGYDNCGPSWPLENVWLGVSVEDQAAADERIPLLLQTPAAVRWISVEPLLGKVFISPWLYRGARTDHVSIDWVVAGGESGPGARPMHPDWIRSIRDQCAAAGVAFHFKQWGAWKPIGPLFCAEDSDEHLAALEADPEEWVRECWLSATRGEWRSFDCQPPPDTWALRRVGKKIAGRLLDGRTHDEYPA